LVAVNATDQPQNLQIALNIQHLSAQVEVSDWLGQPIRARLSPGAATIDLPPNTGAYFKLS